MRGSNVAPNFSSIPQHSFHAGGGLSVENVLTDTEDTEIEISGLIPNVKYRVFVQSENYLYDIDNTTSSSANISVMLTEGGMIESFMHSLKYFHNCFVTKRTWHLEMGLKVDS